MTLRKARPQGKVIKVAALQASLRAIGPGLAGPPVREQDRQADLGADRAAAGQYSFQGEEEVAGLRRVQVGHKE